MPRTAFSGRVASLGPFAVWLGVTAVGLVLRPSPTGHGTHRQLGLPPCPSVVLCDRPCPGCGLTTSWTALLHGDFSASFHAHPLGFLLYATFTGVAILTLRGALTGRPTMSPEVANRLVWAVVAVLLTFGAYRFATTPHYGDSADRAASLLRRLSR